MALPRTQRRKDAIILVVDRFSKITHFGPCRKTNDASYITEIYFKKIIRLHDVPETIALDRDSKFLSHFWRSL